MVKKFMAAAVVVGTIGFAGLAQALPITDTYTAPGGMVELSTGITYIYQHNLLDDGFDPLTQTITNAVLTFSFGPQAGGNDITVALDGTNAYSGKLNDLLGSAEDDLIVNVSYLQSDGILEVKLTKGGGGGSKFQFYGSTLFVDGVTETGDNEGTPGGQEVPEPETLMLFGAGLMGLGLLRRRRSA